MAALLGAAVLPPVAGAGEPATAALRQLSTAEKTGCAGVQRALAAGGGAGLVVRTAVEMGYNPCQVIGCALAGRCPADDAEALEQVVGGAAAAGVPAEVIARCAGDACDPAAVASLLAWVLLEPNYCYFSPRPPDATAPLPPQRPPLERGVPLPEVSPFGF